jgi:tRNA splicing endonuclease
LEGKIIDYPSKNLSELAIYDRQKINSLIQTIGPFLVSKKRQAQLAIQIIEILTWNKRGKLKYPKDLLKAVELAEEIRFLNSNRKNKTIHTFKKVYERLKERGFIS